MPIMDTLVLDAMGSQLSGYAGSSILVRFTSRGISRAPRLVHNMNLVAHTAIKVLNASVYDSMQPN